MKIKLYKASVKVEALFVASGDDPLQPCAYSALISAAELVEDPDFTEITEATQLSEEERTTVPYDEFGVMSYEDWTCDQVLNASDDVREIDGVLCKVIRITRWIRGLLISKKTTRLCSKI